MENKNNKEYWHKQGVLLLLTGVFNETRQLWYIVVCV